MLPEGVPLVGVFLDQNADEVRATAAAVGLGAAQLHGAWLDEDLGVPRYAVVHVHDEASLAVLGARAGAARVLLDGPAGGGLGSSFPWSLAHRARAMHAAELYIAGGLTPQNVAEAIRAGAPAGVDVASGIEGPDGFKDAARVNAFVAAVRGAFQ